MIPNAIPVPEVSPGVEPLPPAILGICPDPCVQDKVGFEENPLFPDLPQDKDR
jgi:hypothetical protein